MQYEQEIRYSRHLSLSEVGKEGQEKLLDAKVLVVGAGGLGSPSLLYLAASGVGTIGIIDDDKVELSNLQRQVLHETSDIGLPKTESAKEALHDLNPNTQINSHQLRLNEGNIESIITNYDIVLDGSDNLETRLLINDYCYKLRKPLVSAAIQGFSGQLSTFKAFLGEPNPCYRCIYPDIESARITQNCSNSGVIGSIAGVMGTWQALEVTKEILGIGESLSGSLIIFDALASASRKIKVRRNKNCACCG